MRRERGEDARLERRASSPHAGLFKSYITCSCSLCTCVLGHVYSDGICNILTWEC